ncbi:IPT/TIG domain-containing protein [Candidatus Poribacteria bacterium]|nr:IPT/TIG domain-containing protein [Candidatus Poribacteria bacterium]
MKTKIFIFPIFSVVTIFTILLALSFGRANAEVLRVPSDKYPTIQSALEDAFDDVTITDTQYGIYCLNSNPQINNVAMTNQLKDGIYCDRSSSTINNVTMTKTGDRGIICYQSSPSINNIAITEAGSIGIGCDDQSSPTIDNVTITKAGEHGISCGGSPRLNHITITGSKIHGIWIGGNLKIRGSIITQSGQEGVFIARGNPDFGTAGNAEGGAADPGNNEIYRNRAFNINNGTSNEIQAVGNWWGTHPPDERLFGGPVNYKPWLTEPPISPLPIIITVEPNQGSVSGGTQIKIMGQRFAQGATVMVGGFPATGVIVDASGTQITATAPPGTPGLAPVTVINPDGTTTTKDGGFKYIGPEILTHGTFNLTLLKGLNMVSLPVRPETPFTAQTLIDTLAATVLIKFDAQRQSFVPYLPGISNDFPIEGGAGYIVNVTEGKTVPFTGSVWDNTAAAPHPYPSPQAWGEGKGVRGGEVRTVWAFVVGGELRSNDFSRSTLTVRNQRTGEILRSTQNDSNRYAVAFADVNRRSVIEAGEVLEVGIDGVDGQVGARSPRPSYTVTPEDLRRAFARIDIDPQFLRPAQTVLLQNYPNPFNPETWMPYQLASDAEVHITIYDTRGAVVRRLELGHQGAGYYHDRFRAAYWDGRNETGERVSSGVYFYQLRAGEVTATRRMVVVK